MFDNDNKISGLHDRSRMKSNNLQGDTPQTQPQQEKKQEVRLLTPNDPSLNGAGLKNLKFSSRNNMESHSYLNDLSNFILFYPN